ncbi:MAG: hypothetical protein SFU86_01010 [Pirellulaceae bacterium]|nr:hypothetical protein [Pirellulaceae bacterium]
MIENELGFQQSIEQLERMYRVVAELRSRMAASNPIHFQLFAEGPTEEIRRLRRDIDEYLGIQELASAGSAVQDQAD